jgi:large subunit ribosomal protein L29
MANRNSKSRKEIKALNVGELKNKAVDIQNHLFQLRMQQKTGQLASTAVLTLARRELARVKTIIGQKQKQA